MWEQKVQWWCRIQEFQAVVNLMGSLCKLLSKQGDNDSFPLSDCSVRGAQVLCTGRVYVHVFIYTIW